MHLDTATFRCNLEELGVSNMRAGGEPEGCVASFKKVHCSAL